MISEHLNPEIFVALTRSELTPEQAAAAHAHLAACPNCSAHFVDEWFTHTAIAHLAQHEQPQISSEFAARMAQLIAANSNSAHTAVPQSAHILTPKPWLRPTWAIAASMFLVAVIGSVQFAIEAHRQPPADAAELAMLTEVRDDHIAMLAAAAPQVLSTDRHTVKPWFQGKLPFTFNLPATMPDGTHLEGANLVYLEGQPAAQLIFSIGNHKATIEIKQKSIAALQHNLSASQQAGFNLLSFQSNNFEGVAVSDAEAARVKSLVDLFLAAQLAPAQSSNNK